jgi:hypothetical protein
MTAIMAYNLTSSDGLVPQFGLGNEIDVKGARYKYLKAAGAIAAYSACTIQNDGDAEEATTTTSGAKPTGVAIPQFDVADLEYFWAPVGPFGLREDNSTAFKVLAATLCATSVKLYTTATDGVVDDTATDLIAGLCLTATNAAGGTVATSCVAVQRLVTNCQD